MRDILLSMNHISKAFPGVQALKDVSFQVAKGEIHALMGENGAGKSTLIKILTGIYQKDSGEILFGGEEIAPVSSTEAQSLGISTIYQEINLVPNLSVCENIFLGRQPKKNGKIDWKQVESQSRELMQGIGVDIDVKALVSDLSTPMQQMVAIVRAMSLNAKIMVVDEATSSLDENEVRVFFDILRRLKAKGIAVIFISHRLNEIYEICDYLTILKDGELVGEYPKEKLSHLELVSKMIGRDASAITKRKKKRDSVLSGAKSVVEVRNISTKSKLCGMSFSIREGEVVGLAGLLGSGRTEIARIIFGADTAYTGELLLNGKPVHFRQPKDAIQAGIAYCSESRMLEGILPNMSVKENLTAAILTQITRAGVVQRKEQEKLTQDYISSMRIKTPSSEQRIKYLSGGNQQKVILSRWMCLHPRLIILDEPTRGIDVGAKAEIVELIRTLAKEKIAVLLISSEMEEIVRNSDRVIVIRDGATLGEYDNTDDLSEDKILEIIAQGHVS